MVYLWMNCLMVIPQIWKHLLDIGWTGLQHFPSLYLKLGSHDIFLTENWVPKIHFNRVLIGMTWYVTLHVFPAYMLLLLIDSKTKFIKMSIFLSLNLWPQFIKPHIYIYIFYGAHISNVFVGCHYQIAVWLVVQVHFQKSIVGLSLSLKRNVQCKLHGPNLWVYLMFANESFIALNSLNSCKHRIGRHRDIARMYWLMLAFV